MNDAYKVDPSLYNVPVQCSNPDCPDGRDIMSLPEKPYRNKVRGDAQSGLCETCYLGLAPTLKVANELLEQAV